MKALWRITSRLRGPLSRRRRESELADEIESHIEMQTDDNTLLRYLQCRHSGAGLAGCCYATNYPFEVLAVGTNPSAVLADQVKSLDWRKRRATRKGILSATELADMRAKVRALVG